MYGSLKIPQNTHLLNSYITVQIYLRIIEKLIVINTKIYNNYKMYGITRRK